MMKIKNKYLAIILPIIGLLLIEIFADRINDYLKQFENTGTSVSTNKATLDYRSSFLNPIIIREIDESVDEYKEDQVTEKTIPRCKKDITVRCFGEFESEDYMYIGEIKNNLPDGRGVAYYDDGFKYTGEFISGKLDGYAVETDNLNRIIYDGDWRSDYYHGYGVLNLIQHQQKYEGYFNEGDYHGTGKYYYVIEYMMVNGDMA